MRITTNMNLNIYRNNLSNVTNNLYKSSNKVLSQRTFSSYAEDPAAASKAFKLRREFSRTSDYVSNTTATYGKFETAWTQLTTVKNLVNEAANQIGLAANNDPSGSSRQTLAQLMSSTAEAVVQTLNVRYSESYVFSGSDGATPPFSWDEASGKLLYRGVAVDSKGSANQAILEQMAAETLYVDVGAGLATSGGTVISATVFDAAISGLNVLGFGVDGDGDPINAVSIMMELSDIYSRCNAETGAYDNDYEKEVADRLTKKLQEALSDITDAWTELDSKATYLNINKERLTDYQYTLNEQILDIEQVDLADAISEYMWAQYCYDAALKIGSDIVSTSLLDYMR